MRFGPTSLRLTSVLAKGLRRPKLRDDLKISEQVIGGESSCVIKIDETDAYARYGAFEYEILSLCDAAPPAAPPLAPSTSSRPPAPPTWSGRPRPLASFAPPPASFLTSPCSSSPSLPPSSS